MRLGQSNQILAQHLSRLLDAQPQARIDIARRMGVSDGTLGRIKYGTANPTIDVVEKIARYFRMEAWELLVPMIKNNVVEEPGMRYRTALECELDDLTDDQRDAIYHLIRTFKGV